MVAIVTLMSFLAPHLIIHEMKVIPLVFSDAPPLIMKNPSVFPSCIINNDIEGNKYGVAILNNTILDICYTQSMQKNVQGKIDIIKDQMKF